jgi:hypothetical protein
MLLPGKVLQLTYAAALVSTLFRNQPLANNLTRTAAANPT